MRRGHSISMAGLAALALAVAWSTPSAAQEPADVGFGSRDAFVFSAERVFGYQSQDVGETTIDSLGMYPTYWGNVGLFGVWASGLTFGSTFGFTYLDGSLFDDDESGIGLLRVGPRIGYAGTTDRKAFGYWVRGGPSGLFTFSDEDSSYAFAASIELYAVIMPVPHFGILVGPHADIHLFGEEEGDEETEYGSIGLTAGLMAEFW
jgi:hypothetical protein